MPNRRTAARSRLWQQWAQGRRWTGPTARQISRLMVWPGQQVPAWRGRVQGSLARYVTKFDFRYSIRVKLGVDDGPRTLAGLRSIVGKRLVYKTLTDAYACKGLALSV